MKVLFISEYAEFDVTSMSSDMGYAVAELDQFPIKLRRTMPLLFEHKHRMENLHRLFPLVA